MTYDERFEQIANSTHLVPFSKNYKIGDFNSGIDEYNEFLTEHAKEYEDSSISKTHILLDNISGDVVGYISLCAGSINLTSNEKDMHDMSEIPFSSIPVLKVGKLAVDRKYREKLKGYGSYLIQLARGFAVEAAESILACRFVVVDADVQHNDKTPQFYEKNGFRYNESYGKKKSAHSISMRLDLFESMESLEQTGT